MCSSCPLSLVSPAGKSGCLDGSASGRITALSHIVCRVDALSDSPVVWSRRELWLHFNQIDNVAGVTWPEPLEYVSPPPNRGQRQRPHSRTGAPSVACRCADGLARCLVSQGAEAQQQQNRQSDWWRDVAGLLDVRVTPTMQCLEGIARDHIPALTPPVLRVDALTDSPVVWSRRSLELQNNKIVNVTGGVTWPASLRYVSPPRCSG